MDKGGRPSEMSEEKVKKLEEVFALDGTIEEACFYADISKTTYYNWLEKKPELVDRFEALRQRPILKARQTIVKGLDQPDNAKWYLSKKKKKEFGDSVDVTSDGEKINQVLVRFIDEDGIKADNN
jgi:hypothetical protein